MRILTLLLVTLSLLLLTSCDPKSDQRAPRFVATECPTCVVDGVCRFCEGKVTCSYCHGTGERAVSTENYAGEGLNTVSYTKECPFCQGSTTCHHCSATGSCLICQGTGTIDPEWKAIKSDPQQN